MSWLVLSCFEAAVIIVLLLLLKAQRQVSRDLMQIIEEQANRFMRHQ